MTTFAKSVLTYYRQLHAPDNLPADVVVMNPYTNPNTYRYAEIFYHRYYGDSATRTICFGINPGRLGAGVTGIPFTDPIQLDTACGIPNDLPKKPELSAGFIHEMITSYGGTKPFFSRYYISAVSPLGYLREGINLNYYDIKGFKNLFESYVVDQIKQQLAFGINQKVAFSIGKGQNAKYLNYINEKYGFFGQLISLPHPRWVMQYRLRRKQEFINEYLTAFAKSEG